MRFHSRAWLALSALYLLAEGGEIARGDPPQAAAATGPVRVAVERGLEFLERDAVQWRNDHECSTCHHGVMTVWALSEARGQGYEVAADSFADTVKWTKDRLLERIDLPRDERPGWSMVSTPALYLSLMAQTVPKQDAVSADELQRIAGHLLRHQESDGSWSWSSAPAANRPPPVFESDEVATLLGCLALPVQAPDDPNRQSEVRLAGEQAAAWLAHATPTDTTQAAALRLLVLVRAGASAETRQAEIDRFFKRQNQDGGWGQLKDSASDAYATGQSLYVLSLAGAKSDREEVRRAVTYLVETQQDDGSWPMKRRGHPGVTPSDNVVPITYFGSAWATLGLLGAAPR